MPRKLGGPTPEEEMKKYRKAWGLNPPPRSAVLRMYRAGYSVPQIVDRLETTSTFVAGVVRTANPKAVGKRVIARPAFKYAHEEITDWSRFKKAHPEAIVRTISADSHRLRIAFYGRKIGTRIYFGKRVPIYSQSKLISVLHPRGEGEKCAFMSALRRTGRLGELLKKGTLPIKKNYLGYGLGGIKFLPCPTCSAMNPVPRAGVYMKCSGCGRPLVSVRVRRRR